MESERHVRALQRSLALSVDDRRETQRELDHTQLALATTQRELESLRVDYTVQKEKVRTERVWVLV